MTGVTNRVPRSPYFPATGGPSYIPDQDWIENHPVWGGMFLADTDTRAQAAVTGNSGQNPISLPFIPKAPFSIDAALLKSTKQQLINHNHKFFLRALDKLHRSSLELFLEKDLVWRMSQEEVHICHNLFNRAKSLDPIVLCQRHNISIVRLNNALLNLEEKSRLNGILKETPLSLTSFEERLLRRAPIRNQLAMLLGNRAWLAIQIGNENERGDALQQFRILLRKEGETNEYSAYEFMKAAAKIQNFELSDEVYQRFGQRTYR